MCKGELDRLLISEGRDLGPKQAGREGLGAEWVLRNASRAELSELSELDQHVMSYLRGRLSEAEIAAELNLPVLAVHRSVRRILRLAGAGSA